MEQIFTCTFDLDKRLSKLPTMKIAPKVLADKIHRLEDLFKVTQRRFIFPTNI